MCGQGATVAMVADMSGEDICAVAEALADLAGQGLAAGGTAPAPAQPMAADLIARAVDPGRRANLHARAAEHLRRPGADVDRIVGHLRRAPAMGEDWAARLWSQHAHRMLDAGQLMDAAGAARRGLAEEPADPDLRTALTLVAARALTRAGHLHQAEPLVTTLEALAPAAPETLAARTDLSLAAFRQAGADLLMRLERELGLPDEAAPEPGAERSRVAVMAAMALNQPSRFEEVVDLAPRNPDLMASTGPGAAIAAQVAWMNVCLRNDDDALRAARTPDPDAMKGDLGNLMMAGTSTVALWVLERPGEADAAMRRFVVRCPPSDRAYRVFYGALAFLDGRLSEAREHLRLQPPDGVDCPLLEPVRVALPVLEALVGDDDEALARAFDSALPTATATPHNPAWRTWSPCSWRRRWSWDAATWCCAPRSTSVRPSIPSADGSPRCRKPACGGSAPPVPCAPTRAPPRCGGPLRRRARGASSGACRSPRRRCSAPAGLPPWHRPRRRWA